MRRFMGHLGGYVVLTVLLTIGTAHGLSGSNTVSSDDIVDGQVYNPDIHDRAVTSAKIKDNSVTGTDIDESTLVLTCPTGMGQRGDLCFDYERSAAHQQSARYTCSTARLRLPSVSELDLLWTGSVPVNGEWSDALYYDGSSAATGLVFSNNDATAASVSSNHPYRCVTTVGARP